MANKGFAITEKQPGWLNKKEMALSLRLSPTGFEKWDVQPIAKIGRETFYDCKAVLDNRLNEAGNNCPTSPTFDITDIADPVEQLKARKLEQEIVALELKNGVLEGRSLPATIVTEVITRVLSPAIGIFETLPLEITRRYPELDQRVIRDIEKAIAKIRNEAAEVPQHLDEILDDIVSEAEERIT